MTVLTWRDRRSLDIQRIMSHIFFIFVGPIMAALFHFRFRYRFMDVVAVRKKFKSLLKETKGPVLICTNHLTMIDSVIQSLAFSSNWQYFFHFKRLAWNLPEKRNYFHKWYYKITCYLSKCIPVKRSGTSKEAKKSLYQMLYVLSKGDIISIFPEGKRSRSGILDTENYSYGVGQLIKEVPNLKILCVYLRGQNQKSYSNFPDSEEMFYVDLEMFWPYSKERGLRKVRDLSSQVIQHLHKMEQRYLNSEHCHWK